MKKNNLIFLFFILLIFISFYISKLLLPPAMWAYMADGFFEYITDVDNSAPFITRGIVLFCLLTTAITIHDYFKKKRYRSPLYKGSFSIIQIMALSVTYFFLGFAINKQMPSETNVAIFYNDIDEVLESLLKVENVNHKDKTGLRPLEASVMFYNNFDVAKILVDLGADINLPNKDGNILLTYARKPVEEKIIQMAKPKIDEEKKQKIIQLLINGNQGV